MITSILIYSLWKKFRLSEVNWRIKFTQIKNLITPHVLLALTFLSSIAALLP
jgi:hypothetical protein